MDKFFNLMYDFFAFAFPGACIIVSFLLFRENDEFLYSQLPPIFANYHWHTFLILALMGYVVGYVIKPIARYLLLINLSIFLFGYVQPYCKYCLCKKDKASGEKLNFAKKRHKSLAMDLMKKNHSYKFTRIRELAPRNAKYIEFWDMHIAMSHNLSFACIIFMAIQLINYWCYSYTLFNGSHMIILFVTIIIAFLVLLRISLQFSFWWSNDSKATLRFIESDNYAKNFHVLK